MPEIEIDSILYTRFIQHGAFIAFFVKLLGRKGEGTTDDTDGNG
jgi:hypothetical protein